MVSSGAGDDCRPRLAAPTSRLTAIVAANDLLGLGCYRAVRSLGKVIGVDVSITGYNDMPLLDLMQPPMTAVRVPYRQMGADAASMLLALMGGDIVSPGRVMLTPTLVVRGSTAPPAVTATPGVAQSEV